MNKKVSLFLAILLAGCGQPGPVRQYTEIFTDSRQQPLPMSDMRAAMPQDEIHAGLIGRESMSVSEPAGEPQLAWDTPGEWKETKGSGLRKATFTSKDPQTKIETTIVTLGGSAGGLQANIVRWMGQINLAVSDAGVMEDFINRQETISTRAGWSGVLVDLTSLQQDLEDTAPSMIAAIIEGNGTQIFVKMTGSKGDVLKHRRVLKNLAQSLHLE